MGRKQPKTIGAALRRARLTKGMTQQEVSEIAAIAPETLSRLERNKVAASLDLTARLAAGIRPVKGARPGVRFPVAPLGRT